jgi:hypothetical protein
MAGFFVNHADFPRGKTVKLQVLAQGKPEITLRLVGTAREAIWQFGEPCETWC